jgi:hypothetical protein
VGRRVNRQFLMKKGAQVRQGERIEGETRNGAMQRSAKAEYEKMQNVERSCDVEQLSRGAAFERKLYVYTVTREEGQFQKGF